MMDRGNGPLTRRGFCGMAVVALFGLATPAMANTAAEDYVTGIAEEVMRLANKGKKGPGLKSQFAALLEALTGMWNAAVRGAVVARLRAAGFRVVVAYTLAELLAAEQEERA